MISSTGRGIASGGSSGGLLSPGMRGGSVSRVRDSLYRPGVVLDASSARQNRGLKDELQVRVKNMPIFIFYSYLFRNDRKLLFSSLFVSYALPIVLESLPWFFSKRKIGNRLRVTRISIHENMTKGGKFDISLVKKYMIESLLYTLIDASHRQLRNRLSMANRFIIRRMVLERLLYSELGAFSQVRTMEFESRIHSDISQTLNLFNYTIPSIFGGFYAMYQEGSELYENRDKIDVLAILHPTVVALTGKAVNWMRRRLLDEKREIAITRNSGNMNKLMSSIMEGLADIQVNNLQQHQLHLLDNLIAEELRERQGLHTFVLRAWNAMSNRNILDFISEVWVVHQVMQRRGIDHEEYRKIQSDVQRVLQVSRRTWALCRMAKGTLDLQGRVADLLNLPNFSREDELLTGDFGPEFHAITIRDIRFRYTEDADPALDFTGEIRIEAGKTYALIGQNRSGKSTLTHILTKIYTPESGDLLVNDTPYSEIPRTRIRELISYVSQRPFIFPGTIRENILVGNPSASEQEVIEAAAAAGVFTFASADSGRGPDAIGRLDLLHDLGDDTDACSCLRKELHASSLLDSVLEEQERTPPEQKQRIARDRAARAVAAAMLGVTEIHAGRHASTAAEGAAPTSSSASPSASVTPVSPTDVSALADVELPACAGASRWCRTCSWCGRVRDSERSAEEMAAIHDQVLSMATEARGANISGGFAQSVALARVFLRTQARVVILDEAMSQMDAFKKREIIIPRLFEYLRKHNMALVLISHSLGVAQLMETIHVLHQGELVASGSHAELVEQKASVYMKLLGNEIDLRL